MFVAAAGVVEVGLSGSIVKEYVCVDDRIAGVEYRLVEQVFERAGGLSATASPIRKFSCSLVGFSFQLALNHR